MSCLGEMIRKKRVAAGLSQKKLGIACGLSDSEILKIENGTRKKPNWINLCKIAKALNFHPFEILLAAGYITEKDISPYVNICGLDKLNEKELYVVQTFISFLISQKAHNGILEGGF